MKRATPPADVQPPLDLEPTPIDPTSEAALRAAYDAADYQKRGISFEEALEDKGLRIALRLHAEAIARKVGSKPS